MARPSRTSTWRKREVHLSAGASTVDRAPAAGIAGGSAVRAWETSMTKQADLKRRIRARMAKTGESYVTARSHLLAALQAALQRPTMPRCT
jgi:hypothetical protein